MTEVLQFPIRCDADVDVGKQCDSRNALWVDTAQKNLCIVHRAAHEQRLAAKAKSKLLHPSRTTP